MPIPLKGDRSAHNSLDYPERHASDLEAGISVQHLPVVSGSDGQIPQWTGNQWIGVPANELGISGSSGGATNFLDLDDTPNSYTGQELKYVRVNSGGNALEFVDGISGSDGGSGNMLASVYDPNNVNDDAFNMENMVEGATNKIFSSTERSKLSGIETGADVTDATNVAAAGAVMNETDPVFVAWDKDYADLTNKPTIPNSFLDLDDTPNSYVGQAGKIPKVNTGETAFEFVDMPTSGSDGGDMYKADYDTNDDGIVDGADYAGYSGAIGSQDTIVTADYPGDGTVLTWVEANLKAEWVAPTSGSGGGATTFLDLIDTPASYSGQAGKFTRVNSTADAIEFVNAPTSGSDGNDYYYFDPDYPPSSPSAFDDEFNNASIDVKWNEFDPGSEDPFTVVENDFGLQALTHGFTGQIFGYWQDFSSLVTGECYSLFIKVSNNGLNNEIGIMFLEDADTNPATTNLATVGLFFENVWIKQNRQLWDDYVTAGANNNNDIAIGERLFYMRLRVRAGGDSGANDTHIYIDLSPDGINWIERDNFYTGFLANQVGIYFMDKDGIDGRAKSTIRFFRYKEETVHEGEDAWFSEIPGMWRFK